MLEKETGIYIDKKLKAFGWDINSHRKVLLEYPINELFADYALLDSDGSVMAVIEAKNCCSKKWGLTLN